jgi:hypothetical protein
MTRLTIENKPATAGRSMSVEWRLSIGTRFTGLLVCPDSQWPSMWRIHYGGRISDMINLVRAKDAAIAWARPRGTGGGGAVVRWDRRETALEAAPVRLNSAPCPEGQKSSQLVLDPLEPAR